MNLILSNSTAPSKKCYKKTHKILHCMHLPQRHFLLQLTMNSFTACASSAKEHWCFSTFSVSLSAIYRRTYMYEAMGRNCFNCCLYCYLQQSTSVVQLYHQTSQKALYSEINTTHAAPFVYPLFYITLHMHMLIQLSAPKTRAVLHCGK